MRDNCVWWADVSGFLSGHGETESDEFLLAHLTECAYCQTAARRPEEAPDELISLLRGQTDDDPYASEPQLLAVLDRLRSTQGATRTRTQAGPDLKTDHLSERVEQLGQYRLLELLGEGGMGTVYLAQHLRLEMMVALKVLAHNRTGNPQAVARFEREMKAVGRISHPNIVKATDAGEADGRHYLAMEFVDGRNLDQVLRSHGRLRISDACKIVRQAALGIEQAHRSHLVHRDLKPSNLMVTTSGEVKVLDLGLARLRDAVEDVALTDEFQMMGTADYMAPEQAFNVQEVDARADIYSLGCTLYALLSGKPPFSGPARTTAMQKLLAHQHDLPPAIVACRPDVPPDLVLVLERAMAKVPAERFSSAEELAEKLRPFTVGAELAPLAHPASVEQNPGNSAGRLPSDHAWSAATYADSPRRIPRVLFRFSRTLLLVIAVGLLGLVVRFSTAGGQIVIEIEGDHISTQLDGEEVVITDRNSGQVYRLMLTPTKRHAGEAASLPLSPGDYMIQVANRESGLHLRTDQFEIRRFGKTIVKAYLSEAADRTETPGDHDVAKWILANGGDLIVLQGGQPIPVTSVAELPQTSFFIQRIRIPRHLELTAADFQRLARRERLTELELNDVSLDDTLVARLATLTRLRAIELECRTIRLEGDFSPLLLLPLEQFSLDGPDVNDAVISRLTTLKQLQELQIRGGDLAGGCLPQLRNLHQLHHLSLAGCELKEMGFQELSALVHLVSLDLSQAKFDEGELSGMGALSQLRRLNLEGTRVTAADLSEVALLRSLQELNLQGTPVTNAGVLSLKQLPGLNTLDLRDTLINDAAVDSLTEFRKLSLLRVGDRLTEEANARLKEELPDCNVEWTFKPAAPLSQRAISEWAIQQGGVVTLVSEEKYRHAGQLAELPQEEFDITAIEFSRRIQPNDAEFDMLRTPPLLNALTFIDLDLTDRIVEQLFRFTHLAVLKLYYNTILPDRLERLAALPNTTEFTLGGVLIGNAQIMPLTRFSGVRGLEVSGHAVTDEALPALATMKNVAFLSLLFTRVKGTELKQLEALPRLDSLHLPYSQITDEGLRDVGHLQRIKWLNLDFTAIGDAGLRHVLSLPELEVLEIWHTNVTDQGIGQLRRIKTLRKLSVAGPGVSDAAVEILAEMNQLTRLQVGSELTPAAVERLRSRLPDCEVVVLSH